MFSLGASILQLHADLTWPHRAACCQDARMPISQTDLLEAIGAPTVQLHSELTWPYRAAGHQDVRRSILQTDFLDVSIALSLASRSLFEWHKAPAVALAGSRITGGLLVRPPRQEQ